MSEIIFDWRDHIQNAVACYMVSICDEKYTDENLTQCYVDISGYINEAIDELLEEHKDEYKIH